MSTKKTICEICGKIFENGNQLRAHKSSHSKKEFQCNICGDKIIGATKYKQHLGNHTNKKKREQSLLNNETYKCDVCDKTFTTQESLSGHMSMHNSKPRFHCFHCNKKFFLKEYYYHIKEVLNKDNDFYIYTNDKNTKNYVKCEICEDKRLDLSNHLLNHHNYTIEQYQKEFPNSKIKVLDEEFDFNSKFQILKKYKKKKKTIKNILKARKIMNKPEKMINKITTKLVMFSDSRFYVNSTYNNEFKIRRRNPDFIVFQDENHRIEAINDIRKNSMTFIKNENVKSKIKKVIEHFGDYWHGEKIVKMSKEDHEKNVISFYKRANIDCLIIWENELEDIEKLKIKIDEFLSS